MYILYIGGDHTLSDEERLVIKECITKLSTIVQSLSQEHKDIHASISKYGRVIDKVRYFLFNFNKY